ncbi:MAG: hypothetical protein ACYCQJ_05190 [Nitrososphaerales archaeon]
MNIDLKFENTLPYEDFSALSSIVQKELSKLEQVLEKAIELLKQVAEPQLRIQIKLEGLKGLPSKSNHMRQFEFELFRQSTHTVLLCLQEVRWKLGMRVTYAKAVIQV